MSDNNDIKLLITGLSKKLDNQFNEVKGVQKEHSVKLGNVDVTLAKQEKELTHHIKIYNDLRTDFKAHEAETKAELKPITKHVNLVGTIFKWSLGAGGLYTLIRIVEYLKG